MRVFRRRHLLLLASSALVVPVACHRAAPVTDASLTSAVQTRLSSDAVLANEPIQATVQDAVVTLNGNVSSDAARALASNDVAQVNGVRTVVNNLSVQSAMTAPAPVVTPVPVQSAATDGARKAADGRRETRERKREERAAKRSSPAPVTRAQVTRAPVATAAVVQAAPVVQAPPVPVTPPPPVVRTITIPVGTILPVRISQTLDSASTQQGQSFSGTIASDVTAEGVTVLRTGSAVSGQVTAVQEAGHFRGNSLLTISLSSVTRRGEHVAIETDSYSAQGKGRGANTAEKVGGGAAVGAILGGIFGGGRGAAIGAAAGGGTGAGVNGLTRGQQVQIAAESLVRFRLSAPVTVRVVGDGAGGETSTPDGARRPLP